LQCGIAYGNFVNAASFPQRKDFVMVAEQKIEARKKTAPYLPFRTFLSSLDTFAQGLPGVLDRTIWRSQAGVTQGLIMNTYRFLGLVDEYDSPTDALEAMVGQTEQRPALLRGLIEATYGHEFGHDFTTTTPKVLEDMFVDSYAVTGATKQKAITFFLKAARFANIALSPFLLTQIRNTATRRKRVKGKDSGGAIGGKNGSNGSAEVPPVVPNSSITVTTHKVALMSGGTLTVAIAANPFKMPQKDRDFVFSLIDMLQQYEGQRSFNEDSDEQEENEE
jgi:hypothetical protein